MGMMMNLTICIMAVICLLSIGSLSQAESSSAEPDKTTVTTTSLSWVPSLPLVPHNDSHDVPADDSKETDEADNDEDYPKADDTLHPHDDSPATGDGSDDEKYLNPLEYPERCLMDDDTAWLCNKDLVLDTEKANDLNKLLENLVAASRICPCQDASCSHTGLPMVVIVLDTIPEYQNKSHKEREEHVRALAMSFLSAWLSGSCENGAVTFVVANDRIVVTVIGEASKPLVSDDCQELVENATSSFFEEGRIGEGLTELIQQYRSIVKRSHSCNSDAHLRTSVVIPIILVIALIIVAAITVTVLLIYRRRGSKDIRTEANVPLKDQQQPEKA